MNHLSLAATDRKSLFTVSEEQQFLALMYRCSYSFELLVPVHDCVHRQTLEHYCDMAAGVKLKRLSDYRITIQRRSMSEESRITAQKQTKGTFLSLADTFCLTWLKLVNILFF